MNWLSYVSLSLLGAVVLAYMWQDTFDAESVRGARVLITGASRGIGEQMAYHYARLGAQIVITARGEEGLKRGSPTLFFNLYLLKPAALNVVLDVQVAQKCVKLGAQKVSYVTGDMSDPADPEKVIRYTMETLGALDYLLLNHVGNSYVELWNRDPDHVRSLMQVNFVSYVQMTAAALPVLEETAGSIVVVSSLAGKLTTPYVAPYASTKFAVNGFFGTLQNELTIQKSNVSVTIMILGLIDTETAMNKIRGFSTMTAYPASEAALNIIKAGATRQKEAFCPSFHYYTCLFRDWLPFIRELLLSDLSMQTEG